MDQFTQEVQAGERFTFGKNWSRFLSTLNEERILQAEKSLQDMLKVSDLRGTRFLDVGSGSGLFSLAAKRLGAEVVSFDYDPHSVACAQKLKADFFPKDPLWTIERGSVLNIDYLRSLGHFNVVYSWGVLHHTGRMWEALSNICETVQHGGRLYIAIYNDQGFLSKFWWWVKKIYCSGMIGRSVITVFFVPYFALRAVVKSVVTGTNVWADYKRKNRGMSLWHDWVDWLGGFPFEVASAEVLSKFYDQRGFSLQKVKTTVSLGNNEFVFVKR